MLALEQRGNGRGKRRAQRLYPRHPGTGEPVHEAGGASVFAALGPEPLDDGFTLADFRRRLRKRSGRLKPLLLDQSFVAGIGKMSYARFALFNVVGGLAWILIFVLGGYFFGNIPVVKRNFTLVILAIIVLSVLPAVIEVTRARRASAR